MPDFPHGTSNFVTSEPASSDAAKRTISAKFATQRLFGLSLAVVSAVSLTVAMSCSKPEFLQAARADGGKTTQFFRSQALQNIAAGRESEALESYKAAIKVARTQYGQESTYLSELYFEMGNLARSNGQSEIAQDCYQSAVKYRPNDIPTRLQLADLERNTKNIREAFDESKKAFQLSKNSPIARKGLMLCLQQCGRPAEAAQIAATIHHEGQTVSSSKLPANIPNMADHAPSPAKETAAMPAVAVSPVSALHWAPGLKKKIDEAAAKKIKDGKDAQVAEEARKKQIEDNLKNERSKEQHKKDEAEHKKKAKKEETAKKKDDASKKATPSPASKVKPAFVEPEVNSASLKTSAKTISGAKSDEKAEKGDKADKSTDKSAEKPASKGRLNVGAVTERTEKPAEEKHESSVSENEPAKVKVREVERSQAVAPQMMMPTVTIPVTTTRPKNHSTKAGGTGFVPPPPATPYFPSAPGLQQMPPMMAPAPAPQPKIKKSKPVVKEAPKESSDEPSATPTKGQTEDPNFLIDWGADTSKKKHSK